MSSSGEDCDEVVEEDLIEDSSQPSQKLPHHKDASRASKRRRTYDSEDDSIDDFIDDGDENYQMFPTSRKGLPVPIEQNSLDEFKETRVGKRKSKYKIHIPRDNTILSTMVQYGTQQEDSLDSSPYRTRGAKWKLPVAAAAATKSPPAKILTPKKASTQTSLSFGPSPSSNAPALKFTNPKTATAPVLPLQVKNSSTLVPPLGPSPEDVAKELDDLPSDAFLSSPEIDLSQQSHTNPPSQPRKGFFGPHTGFRQTTLFGGRVPLDEEPSPPPPPPSQVNKVHNYRVDMVPEAPTHHKLDHDALETWVYPTNLGPTRDYQFNIVRQGLFNNMLVALPTGLGKTFIAATIMLNYFRWTKDAKIVFMAPTKPLVAQQVDACFNIAGIPRSVTTMLTGEIPPAVREEEWQKKRVFFMTPQTIDNDLRTGIADPMKIVLLVVDEAHRATGNYSYVKVVSFMRRFSKSFRILALTATPGASVETVQEVIDGLEISKVEIRTEESMDIQQFTHQRKIEQIVLDPSDDMMIVKDLLSKALKPLVDQLCVQNAYWNRDPMALTPFGLMQAKKAWLVSGTGRRANPGLKGMVMGLFGILASVAHGIKLLNFHGIGPFYSNMKDFRAGVEEKGNKAGKYRKQVNESLDFRKLMDQLEAWITKHDFVGHPKLSYLCDIILNHFLDAGEGRLPDGAPHSGTRVIVFSEYRDSAEEICRVLNRHKPMIRASVFVGQTDSKRSEGMNQAKQISTISKFKTGAFNVLVATSIGEEGLDIGQVDLIVCYDASGSPIRMLQRMGRTGRKRAGKIVLLLMRGKEEEAFAKSKDNYEQMQRMIASGTRFKFRHDLSTRIIPKDISPAVDKRHVEIPLENTQDLSLPEPKRRPAKPKKKSAKKFHMPDGVETGFRKASKLVEGSRDSEESDSQLCNKEPPMADTRNGARILETSEAQLMPIPEINSVLLSATDLKDLELRYQNVYGDDIQEVSMPDMDCQPEFQRTLGPSKLVKHSKATERFVCMIEAMRNMTEAVVDKWDRIYEDQGPLNLQASSALHSLSSAATSSHTLQEKRPKLNIPHYQQQQQPSRAAKARKRRSPPSFPEDQNDTSHDDSELEEFVIRDKEPLYKGRSASADYMPSKKPFYEPTQFTATQYTNDDDDDGDDGLPAISNLLESRAGRASKSLVMQKRVDNNLMLERGPRKKRKRILEEDSDE